MIVLSPCYRFQERENQKKMQSAEQLFQKEWMKPREVSTLVAKASAFEHSALFKMLLLDRTCSYPVTNAHHVHFIMNQRDRLPFR